MLLLLALCVLCCKFVIFTEEYYVKLNTVKFIAMRIGPRFNVTCAPFTLDGMYQKYFQTFKIGVVVNAAKSFKCSMVFL